MSKPTRYRKIIDLYPEEAREAADILKRAVPLMMRHALPPNPVHFALWYTYCKGRNEELKRRLDKAVVDYGGLPPELAEKMFREFIIDGELDEARAGQQQVIELVDAIEGGISSSVSGSAAFQETLSKGLAALQEPVVDELPNVLNDLQQSTQVMQDQQEKFLYRLRAAQSEIASLRHQLERAHLAATLDPLTQIFNRSSFTRLLEQSLKAEYRGVALVMLDIDHFKQFNDQYGHPLGDRVLEHVGRLLRDLMPAKAIAARYGGEEFCVTLHDCPDYTTAFAFAEQMRTKFMALRVKVRSTDKVLDSITASFGIALARPDEDIESLITRADDALYQAKRNGRNQTMPVLDDAASA